MLTKLLIRNETPASLGKMKHIFTVLVSGETISQLVTQVAQEINPHKPTVFQLGTSVTFLKLVPLIGG
jgi:hypothetical protein